MVIRRLATLLRHLSLFVALKPFFVCCYFVVISVLGCYVGVCIKRHSVGLTPSLC